MVTPIHLQIINIGWLSTNERKTFLCQKTVKNDEMIDVVLQNVMENHRLSVKEIVEVCRISCTRCYMNCGFQTTDGAAEQFVL